MNTVRQLKPRTTAISDGEYGDGDEGDMIATERIEIRTVKNGWMVKKS